MDNSKFLWVTQSSCGITVTVTELDSRKTALLELKREALMVGADAVIGIDLDYTEFAGAGKVVMLIANGTAVKLVD